MPCGVPIGGVEVFPIRRIDPNIFASIPDAIFSLLPWSVQICFSLYGLPSLNDKPFSDEKPLDLFFFLFPVFLSYEDARPQTETLPLI